MESPFFYFSLLCCYTVQCGIIQFSLTFYMLHFFFNRTIGISDNDRCISLRGYGWLDKFTDQRMGGMPVHRCNGNDADAVYAATSAAVEFSRKRGAPSAVVFEGLSRRFGHAATDRQVSECNLRCCHLLLPFYCCLLVLANKLCCFGFFC